ncbi:MAG: hypothetical protein NUV34_07450 [Sulfuricaulis sp.]|nr:hypothetical protein [Sulfuricaulis sp.]
MRKTASKTDNKPARQAGAGSRDDKLRQALAALNRMTGAPLKVECRGGVVFVDMR